MWKGTSGILSDGVVKYFWRWKKLNHPSFFFLMPTWKSFCSVSPCQKRQLNQYSTLVTNSIKSHSKCKDIWHWHIKTMMNLKNCVQVEFNINWTITLMQLNSNYYGFQELRGQNPISIHQKILCVFHYPEYAFVYCFLFYLIWFRCFDYLFKN